MTTKSHLYTSRCDRCMTIDFTEAKLHQKLMNLFKKPHIDNQEVLHMLFALKDDLPLKNCSTQEKVKALFLSL